MAPKHTLSMSTRGDLIVSWPPPRAMHCALSAEWRRPRSRSSARGGRSRCCSLCGAGRRACHVPRSRGACDSSRPRLYLVHPFRLSGTLPPFSSSLCITALCSALFCSAEPSAPAWTSSSCANSFRAAKLELRSSSISRSTIDVRQLLGRPLAVVMLTRIASTSTPLTGVGVGVAGGV